MGIYDAKQNFPDPYWLPPIHLFHRPVWVYNYILGWDIVRVQLFGNTEGLMQELDSFGDEMLPRATLDQLAKLYTIHPAVRELLRERAINHNAQEVATWYRDWETRIFIEYRDSAKRISRHDKP